jgi:hypothetical protein
MWSEEPIVGPLDHRGPPEFSGRASCGLPTAYPPIELIDGQKLLDMFIKLELGIRPVTAYELDYSFFEEFKT